MTRLPHGSRRCGAARRARDGAGGHSRRCPRASAGTGRLLVIEGPAGIGKTRLLRAAREARAKRRCRCCTPVAPSSSASFPTGSCANCSSRRSPMRRTKSGERSCPERRRAVEPLLAQGESLPLPAVGDSSFPILHGLYWLTANLAERRPVLLAIDDAHWGDLESLALPPLPRRPPRGGSRAARAHGATDRAGRSRRADRGDLVRPRRRGGSSRSAQRRGGCRAGQVGAGRGRRGRVLQGVPPARAAETRSSFTTC